MRMLLLVLILVFGGRAQAQGGAQDGAQDGSQEGAPAGWGRLWPYLLGSVCTDAADRPVSGVTPLDGGCLRRRTLRLGEALPYHKHDWPGLADRFSNPDGYQRADAYPVRTALGVAVLQTYDFGTGGRAFGRFDPADGGQVAFFSRETAAFGITEDGGAGLQLFIGPGCRPLDSWIIVDRTFEHRGDGEALARITRNPERCPDRLGSAYTRWHVEPIRFRVRTAAGPGAATLATLVSDHFGGGDVAGADHLERMYFTEELGYTRWERWQNQAVQNRAEDRRHARAIAESGRCDPALPAPLPTGWILTDCREWTQVLAAPPGGDAPDFWLDRLRLAPATAALFGR